MLEVEQERAKERQGERADLDEDTSAKDFTEVERATEKAAEKVREQNAIDMAQNYWETFSKKPHLPNGEAPRHSTLYTPPQ